MSGSAIKLSEYAKRRAGVAKALNGAAGLVFAGDGGDELLGSWRPDRDFAYLTGIEDEAGAALLLDPTNDDPAMREVLFLRPLNPELERWDGLREWIGEDLRERTGFKRVLRTTMLPSVLTKVARRAKKLGCLHTLAPYSVDVSADLAVFKRVAERVPGVSITDCTDTLPLKRSVKSSGEVKAIEAAIGATKQGLVRLLAAMEPGVTERHLCVELESGYGHADSQGHAFNPIIGSGGNATVLHYKTLHGTCNNGELVLLDTGARVDNYCADISRTVPVNGRFNKRQKELYELVLKAQETSIRMMKPGVKWSDIDAASKDVIRKGGFPEAYPHGLGHHLGMDVHDPQPDGPLKAGMVLTVEPGLYLPDEGVGIRIEDDVLVTAKGPRVLSKAIPKKVKDVEAWMRSVRG